MDFIIPAKELEELGDVLDSGKLEPLRNQFEGARLTKQPLTKYTSRIWLFPLGTHPSLKHPVEVFRNGMTQWMDHELKLIRVGKTKPIIVVVFLQETKEGDLIQATYMALPSKNR